MSNIYDIAQEFRAQLLRGERGASSELLRAYALAVKRIERRIETLTSQIEDARAQGAEINAGWLHERGRLEGLRREILVETQRFSRVAELRIAREQHAARDLGNEAGRVLVGEATGSPAALRLGSLNPSAVSAAIGFAADGSPLRDLFAERGPRVARRVADELVAGIAEGAGVRVIARRIRGVFGGELARALTIARTETLRAYREATQENYLAHSDSLSGWYWAASFGSRTCAMCIAMHGRVFPLSKRLTSHPNCRCVMVPLTPGARLPQTGVDWFARQDPGYQKSILGLGKFEAYRDGRIKLEDLVGVKRSERWGPSHYERPLHLLTK